jgi:hypothetical protein
MRKIEYLSPSSIAKFEEDQESFYVRYLSEHRLPDEPQTQPMSIGSAFDAYAKSFIHERLFGKGNDPKYQFDNIFQAQVETHNRDTAIIHGKYAFECYQKSGALADLMLELEQAVNVPKFEIEVRGVISGYREGITLNTGGVTFLGKPDVFFINKHGAHVILDWKVNGYYSKYNKSPMPGYVRLRQDTKKSGQHKDCALMMHNGTLINGGQFLEQLDSDWGRQLSIYGWLLGCEIGEDFIVAVDQLCCSPNKFCPDFPDIRIAEHRLRTHKDFQYKLFARAQYIWNLCHSDHFFQELSKEDSQSRCALLDQQAIAYRKGLEDPVFLALTRSEPPKWKNKPKL